MAFFGKNRKKIAMQAAQAAANQQAAEQAAKLKKQQEEMQLMEQELLAEKAKGVKAGIARRNAMGGGAGVRSGGSLLSVQPATQQGGLQTMLGGGNRL